MRRRLLGREVRAALAAVLIARVAVNGGYRIVYPFLPEIARGLGTTLGVVGVLLALRAGAGLVAPLVPHLSDRVGRRAVMLLGVAASAIGCLVIAGAPGVILAGVGFVAIGLSKPLFDIPMQGWFSARVPIEQRGRVLGITELTWALSLGVAVPAGFLITATSWRAPFLLVVGLLVLGAVAVARLMGSDRPAERVRRPLRWHPSLIALLGVVLLFRYAAETLFVVYGSWLEDDVGLSVAAIGVFTALVVAAELTGEGSVAAFADRLGLRRTVFFGLLVTTGVYASLGFVGGSLPAAMLAVVGWFVAFEITIVATIPLASVLGGEGRERLLALVAALGVGSSGIAALTAPQLYRLGGIGLCGLVAAGCTAAAALLLTQVSSRPLRPGSATPSGLGSDEPAG